MGESVRSLRFSCLVDHKLSADPSAVSASETESVSDKEEKRRKKKSHRRRRDSRSRSPGNGSDTERKLKKSKRDKPKKSHKSKLDNNAVDDIAPRKETEEEYDARLEREENERLAEEKLRELARAAEKLARQAPNQGDGGVVYKGRGRMKYIDPESKYYRRD